MTDPERKRLTPPGTWVTVNNPGPSGRARRRPAGGLRMRAAVYVVVWAVLAVALVLDDPAGEHLSALTPQIAIALAITVIDLATVRLKEPRP